jgi:hypothetical protein
MSQAHRACSVLLLMTLVILWFRFSDAMLASLLSLADLGLWPHWSIPVSQAHRACSVMLLLDANLLQLTKLAIPDDALLVSPTSLSAIILTEVLFWNLHFCNLQLTLVNTCSTSLPQLSNSNMWYANAFPGNVGSSTVMLTESCYSVNCQHLFNDRHRRLAAAICLSLIAQWCYAVLQVSVTSAKANLIWFLALVS